MDKYSVILTVSDNYKSVSSSFKFSITNKAPYVNRKLQNLFGEALITNTKFYFDCKDSFLDLEGDELKYSLLYNDNNKNNEIKIDKNNCIISGTPIKPRTKDPNII